MRGHHTKNGIAVLLPCTAFRWPNAAAYTDLDIPVQEEFVGRNDVFLCGHIPGDTDQIKSRMGTHIAVPWPPDAGE
ncbi:MAG: hypothetical protein FWE62_02310 [Firmicutes bacterium]|nr:hypothetical protein [Bacillota bacterium]